jgi:Flp pilus assembly protein TadG
MSFSQIRIRIGTGPDRIDIGAKESGQIIVIFALMLTVLIGVVGIAIDVTYAWRSGLQIQRAADAAAMAGVVYLPGALPTGQAKAAGVAAVNGYSAATGATVVSKAAPSNPRDLDVTITAPVPTFFVKLFGINSWTVSRTARAAYVLPVPMGSPLSYMGVGCYVLKPGQQTPVPGCSTTGNGQSGVTANNSAFNGSNSLGSLGAWGAISAPGGDEQNGDAYAPKNNTGSPATNVMYPKSNPGPGADGYKGYLYTVALPAGGDIKIFDPGFCAMGAGTAGNYGAGDHWVGSSGSSNPVSTYYNLFNTNGQPLNPNAWTYAGITSGTTFENQTGSDTANGGPTGGSTCSSAWHNKWWTLVSGQPAGTYELEVTTTNVTPATLFTNNPTVTSETSDGTNGQNMFAIQATGVGSAVFGYDKMAVYNNLSANNVIQQFYIAQVDQITGAGKTLTIDLFDIGDSTAGTIQILSPDTSGPNPVAIKFNYTTFSYNSTMTRVSPGNCVVKAYSACSGDTVPSITVAGSNGSSFNNTWIEISIPLPTNYGSGGLWKGGWWQVQYNVSAGSDLTTWSVNVNGNPVHLVTWP